jgi:hypothetical protein
MGIQVSHGEAARKTTGKTTEYSRWETMLGRCRNPNHSGFKYYGARGIKVCERWLIFENFLADIGRAPAGMTLDRYPNKDGDYEPGNVRWATPKQQSRNRRISKLYSFSGESLTLAEWSERIGIGLGTLRARIKYGWSIQKSLTEPKQLFPIVNSLEHRLRHRINAARHRAKSKAVHDS